ncbi:hypothetical protein DESC_850001 [Desulfosarcina cetonica]|nr:hypothetical protein DESC_850001 [Desulfosarcina cetonica]
MGRIKKNAIFYLTALKKSAKAEENVDNFLEARNEFYSIM